MPNTQNWKRTFPKAIRDMWKAQRPDPKGAPKAKIDWSKVNPKRVRTAV